MIDNKNSTGIYWRWASHRSNPLTTFYYISSVNMRSHALFLLLLILGT